MDNLNDASPSRKDIVAKSFVETCKSTSVGLFRPQISLLNHYVYFPIPKAANSTIKWLLYYFETGGRLSSSSTVFRKRNENSLVHDPYFGPLLLPASIEAGSQIDYDLMSPAFFRFSFVRNPYTRSLSAYLDRAQHGNSNLAKSVENSLGQSRFTFLQMLEAVAAMAEEERELHVKHQATLLGGGEIHINHVAFFENFAPECILLFQRIWPTLGEEVITAKLKETMVSPARTEAESKIKAYLGPKEADLVYEMYRQDFELFGYSRDIP